MFRLAQTETFRWPVAWEVPGDGKLVPVSFTAVFHRLSQSEVESLVEGAMAEANVTETARRLLAGWGEDVLDDDGDPLPFTAANVGQLLDVTGAAAAVTRAFFDAVSGKGARKN